MKCYALKQVGGLRVLVVYIAVTNGGNIDSYAPRFAQTYRENAAGYPHDLLVVCNGGPLVPRRKAYFDGIKCDFLPRENDGGWDVGAYQAVAESTDYDFLVCLGESVYFHRPGWLDRLIQARIQFGPGMYGYFATHAVRAHLNTTAFGIDPQFLVKYPRVLNHGARYEFEHGAGALWRRIVNGGSRAVFVTWDGYWMPGEWRRPSNGLNAGNQNNCCVFCNHVDRYNAANSVTKSLWQSGADQPYI